MHSIQETPTFVRNAARLLEEDELAALLVHVAFHPASGDLIPGGSGLRKLRWATQNKGKSGGVRTIYFFYDSQHPITMMAIYGKNERSNLSKAELQAFAEAVKEMKTRWRSK